MFDTETSADEINHDMETEEDSAANTMEEKTADTKEEATDDSKKDFPPKLKKLRSPLVPKKAKQASKKAATSAAKVAPSGNAKKNKKTYEEMVLHAVKGLKSKNGSSRAATLPVPAIRPFFTFGPAGLSSICRLSKLGKNI